MRLRSVVITAVFLSFEAAACETGGSPTCASEGCGNGEYCLTAGCFLPCGDYDDGGVGTCPSGRVCVGNAESCGECTGEGTCTCAKAPPGSVCTAD